MKNKIQTKNIGIALKLIVKNDFTDSKAAAKTLGLGSQQALTNLLTRFSNDKGSFSSLKSVLKAFGYSIEYTLTPLKQNESDFSYQEFEQLIELKKYKKADKMVRESSFLKDEKLKLFNKITNAKDLSTNHLMATLILDEESIERVFEVQQPISFSEKINQLIKRPFLNREVFDLILNKFQESDPQKIKLIDLLEGYSQSNRNPILHRIPISNTIFLNEKIYVEEKGIDGNLVNITNAFKAVALRTLSYKKNQEKFEVESIMYSNGKVVSLFASYDNRKIIWMIEDERIDI